MHQNFIKVTKIFAKSSTCLGLGTWQTLFTRNLVPALLPNDKATHHSTHQHNYPYKWASCGSVKLNNFATILLWLGSQGRKPFAFKSCSWQHMSAVNSSCQSSVIDKVKAFLFECLDFMFYDVSDYNFINNANTKTWLSLSVKLANSRLFK